MRRNELLTPSVVQRPLNSAVHTTHGQPIRLVEVWRRAIVLQLAVLDDNPCPWPVPVDRQPACRPILPWVAKQPFETMLSQALLPQHLITERSARMPPRCLNVP